MLNDTSHNIYFRPCLASMLRKRGIVTKPEIYDLGIPTVLYPASAPVNDKGLLNHQGKLTLDVAKILTSAETTEPWAQQVPNLAALVRSVNFLVGAVGCDKLSDSGLRKRFGVALCLTDMTVRALLFLGKFLPAFRRMGIWLTMVQVVVKVGDELVEFSFPASQEEGLAILRGVQLSALSGHSPEPSVNELGAPVTSGSAVPTPGQKLPPPP
jgi:hypothetical protein